MSRKLSPRALTALALAVLLAFTAAACGNDDEGGGDSGASGDKKQVSVAMELILTGQEFGVEIKNGIEAFEREDGKVDIEANGPPDVNPEVAQKQAADMLSKRPDAFGVAPFPPELWTRTVKNITEQVSPNVLSFNERPASLQKDAAASPIKTFVGTADATLARQSAESTIKLGKIPRTAKGVALIGQCVPQEAGVLAMRTQAVKEVLAKRLPDVKPVVFDSKPTQQPNTEAWATKLAATPNPVLAIGVCTQDGPSLNKVITDKNYDFPAGAMDAAPGTVAGIKNGSLLQTVAVNWWLQGYASARMLTEAARGEKLPEGFVNTGVQVVTKDNVEDLDKRLDQPKEFYADAVKKMFAGGMPKAVPMDEAYE